MLELSREILDRLAAGERFALATVTEVHGSAPRPPGAAMLVGADGRIAGNVSAGCVDGAVVELCRDALDGAPPRRAEFGIDDESAFVAGLACGGELEVFVRVIEPDSLGPAPIDALERVRAGADAGIATIVSGPPALVGRVIDADGPDDRMLRAEGVRGLAADRLRAEIAARIAAGQTGMVRFDCDGEPLEVFVESRLAPPLLVIAGAVAVGAALAEAARPLGYRVLLVDPRPGFATAERFPAAHEVRAAWPADVLAAAIADGSADARTVVAVLTHDVEVELPLLALALETTPRFAYVGAMGSRRTDVERRRRLAAFGVTEADLDRLHSPIGLDLGATTPAEIAVSILAEVVAVRSGRTAQPLRAMHGSIHAFPAGAALVE
ncbi:XdhC family protein [Agromyces seonyuensis]|uniref:XdhC/CoxI family protein n=1 Tax=Agromyces seonyuensis TaxID=2662446 RepID=A0A6I4NSW4_9MICO|nr:XdhC family protein [Agromyces seonyuensis]MWB97528.1 XdhC/CoxI family protein [Agromyces seonyuensis]